jgi:hypothetical protein
MNNGLKPSVLMGNYIDLWSKCMNNVGQYLNSEGLIAFLDDCVKSLEANRLLLRTYLNLDSEQLIDPVIFKKIDQIDRELQEHKAQIISILQGWSID